MQQQFLLSVICCLSENSVLYPNADLDPLHCTKSNFPKNFSQIHLYFSKFSEQTNKCQQPRNFIICRGNYLNESAFACVQIRIDRLVDKWSGSIEIGITTHNPNLMEFPATMTNMRSGLSMHSFLQWYFLLAFCIIAKGPCIGRLQYVLVSSSGRILQLL